MSVGQGLVAVARSSALATITHGPSFAVGAAEMRFVPDAEGAELDAPLVWEGRKMTRFPAREPLGPRRVIAAIEPMDRGDGERRHQRPLQRLHDLGLGGAHVVVAEQMQDPVCQQERRLLLHAVAARRVATVALPLPLEEAEASPVRAILTPYIPVLDELA